MSPRIIRADGSRALCGVVTHKPCVRLAVYPDGCCAVHTGCLAGSHHERIRLDQDKKGLTRKRAWQEWNEKRTTKG